MPAGGARSVVSFATTTICNVGHAPVESTVVLYRLVLGGRPGCRAPVADAIAHVLGGTGRGEGAVDGDLRTETYAEASESRKATTCGDLAGLRRSARAV